MTPDEPRAMFAADGDRFVPTVFTRGPWSADAQHAGPSAGLVGRLAGEGPMRVARLVLEVLRPIPVEPLTVTARVTRPGKRVQLTEAAIADEAGAIVAHATAWRIRADAGAGVPHVGTEDAPSFPGPSASRELPVFSLPWRPNYFDAIEWRVARGAVVEPGPAACWMRARVPLVEGEEPSPLVRVLVAADSGNGISTALPLDLYLFINVDLTVHLAREPRGEWVCLDSETRIAADGVGVAESAIWDEAGRLGVSAQSLLVGRR
jgi:hypothetical protein